MRIEKSNVLLAANVFYIQVFFSSAKVSGLSGFVQSLVDASYGTIDADEPGTWRPDTFELGPTSGALVYFALPDVDHRVRGRQND